jgi:hypothetical protein
VVRVLGVARLEREGESVQLVLGQGVLSWRLNDGDIYHPVVSQKLQIAFDPFTPEFRISETAQPPELLRPLLSVSQDVAAQTIQQAVLRPVIGQEQKQSVEGAKHREYSVP